MSYHPQKIQKKSQNLTFKIQDPLINTWRLQNKLTHWKPFFHSVPKKMDLVSLCTYWGTQWILWKPSIKNFSISLGVCSKKSIQFLSSTSFPAISSHLPSSTALSIPSNYSFIILLHFLLLSCPQYQAFAVLSLLSSLVTIEVHGNLLEVLFSPWVKMALKFLLLLQTPLTVE